MSHEEWRPFWGSEYRREIREMEIRTLFIDLERDGLLGRFIVDIGSGAHPVTSLLDSSKHTIVTIDVVGLSGIVGNKLHIRGDAESLVDTSHLSTKKALVQIAQFAEINLRHNPQIEQVDTMIFSQLLNYVDFRSVLSGAAVYLKPGGLFVIVNQPNSGIYDLFSQKGIKNNSELLAHLKEQQFTKIKELYILGKDKKASRDESMLILAVQKYKPIPDQSIEPIKPGSLWDKFKGLNNLKK